MIRGSFLPKCSPSAVRAGKEPGVPQGVSCSGACSQDLPRGCCVCSLSSTLHPVLGPADTTNPSAPEARGKKGPQTAPPRGQDPGLPLSALPRPLSARPVRGPCSAPTGLRGPVPRGADAHPWGPGRTVTGGAPALLSQGLSLPRRRAVCQANAHAWPRGSSPGPEALLDLLLGSRDAAQLRVPAAPHMPTGSCTGPEQEEEGRSERGGHGTLSRRLPSTRSLRPDEADRSLACPALLTSTPAHTQRAPRPPAGRKDRRTW